MTDYQPLSGAEEVREKARDLAELCRTFALSAQDGAREAIVSVAFLQLAQRADELEAALSLPAAQDGDGVPAGWRLRRHPNGSIEAAKGHHSFVVERAGNPFDSRIWDFLNDILDPTPNAIRGDKGADYVAVSGEVVRFLNGEAPLDGYWFADENHPNGRPYWWRKYLDAAPTQAAAKDTP